MATLQRQVRLREMEFEMRQACQLKAGKEKRRQKFQHLLKELWRDEREMAIAELAEECKMALHCIGEGHAAAILVMLHQEARNVQRARQVAVNQQQEVSRFNTALEKERLRRKLESKPKTRAKRQRNVKDSTTQWERSIKRFASHNSNFKLLSKPFLSGMPGGWFAVHKENCSLLRPSDYKHTFLHSHLFMNQNEANVSFKSSEIDAWKAAEVHTETIKNQRVLHDKIQYIMSKRKVMRGQLAGSKLMIEQRLQLLERENHVIKRSEWENTRNMLHREDVAKPSKAPSQGVEVDRNDGCELASGRVSHSMRKPQSITRLALLPTHQKTSHAMPCKADKKK